WEPEGAAFAAAWRRQPKWVVSRSLTAPGPNAQLLGPDIDAAVQALKATQDGDIAVAGPTLAEYLGSRGLIDEYRIYLHPVVLGQGRPFFTGPRPALHLIGQEVIDGDVICLRYTPA
ncbi:MAG: dihydrofolate reductase family protein, partial [Roseinatronobacter sp.]